MKIDFGFKGGNIKYKSTEFDDAGKAHDLGSGTMAVLQLPETSDTVLRELSDKEVRVSGHGGTDIEYAVLNHENPDSDGAIIYNMGAGGNMRHPQAVREIGAVASLNPDRQVLVINNAGAGRSSLMPVNVMDHMKQNGSYLPEGDLILKILSDQLEKYGDKIDVWGHSAGARVAMGMAAAFGASGQRIDSLIAVDPPSAIDRSPFGIQMKFASQVLSMIRYGKSPYNETEELGTKPISSAWVGTMAGAMKTNIWDLPLTMRHSDGLERDLGGAITAVNGNLTIVSPEHSEFAKPDSMEKLISRAVCSSLVDLPDSVRQLIVRGHSHSILSSNSGVAPQMTLYKIAKQN